MCIVLVLIKDFARIGSCFEKAVLPSVYIIQVSLWPCSSTQVSYWSNFIIQAFLLVNAENPRLPIGFFNRFLLYALPCMILAIGINIPKFFEVDLIFR
jgi:hypothetical protein